MGRWISGNLHVGVRFVGHVDLRPTFEGSTGFFRISCKVAEKIGSTLVEAAASGHPMVASGMRWFFAHNSSIAVVRHFDCLGFGM
jgi:hypothetical protein